MLLKNLLSIPSPSGHTDKLTSYIKKLDTLNITYQTTNKGVIIVTFKGENEENHRIFSAHIDTLGGIIREIKSNEALSILFASHTYERTHIDSLIATLKLVLKYCQSQ